MKDYKHKKNTDNELPTYMVTQANQSETILKKVLNKIKKKEASQPPSFIDNRKG